MPRLQSRLSETSRRSSAQASLPRSWRSRCNGVGASATVCQLYKAFGGANPINRYEPTTEERLLAGAGAILNALGLVGVIRGGGLSGSAAESSIDSGAKAIGAVGKPLVSKGSEVTPEIVQKALQGDPAISAQGAVSLPAVQRYVDRILKGDVAPAIKMDGNVIVDGNHRYIAAKILGRNPDVTPEPYLLTKSVKPNQCLS